MYSEADIRQINARIKKNWLALGPVLAALLGAYIYALAAGIEWLAMVVGPLIFVAACYGVLAYLSPNMGYRRFLQDMQTGLSRDVSGVIVEVSEKEEAQDGARVLPVRIRLDEASLKAQGAPGASVASRRMGLESAQDTEDERIVYLNVSKRGLMPPEGTRVLLHCFGRHIKAVERI